MKHTHRLVVKHFPCSHFGPIAPSLQQGHAAAMEGGGGGGAAAPMQDQEGEEPRRDWLLLLDCGALQYLAHTGTGERQVAHGCDSNTGLGSTVQGGPWQLQFSGEGMGALASIAPAAPAAQVKVHWANDILNKSRHRGFKDGCLQHYIFDKITGTASWVRDGSQVLEPKVFKTSSAGHEWRSEVYWHRLPKCPCLLYWVISQVMAFLLDQSGHSRRNLIGKSAPHWRHQLEAMGLCMEVGHHFRHSSKSLVAASRARQDSGASVEHAIPAEQEFSLSTPALILLICWRHASGNLKSIRCIGGTKATAVLLGLLLGAFFAQQASLTVHTACGLQLPSRHGRVDLSSARASERQAGVKTHSSLFKGLDKEVLWARLLTHLASISYSSKCTESYKGCARPCLASISETLGMIIDCSSGMPIWTEASLLELPVLPGPPGAKPRRVSIAYKSEVVNEASQTRASESHPKCLQGFVLGP